MDQDNYENIIAVTLNERGVRAISSAVEYTLDKWAGEGFMDQEALIEIRMKFRAMILELNLDL